MAAVRYDVDIGGSLRRLEVTREGGRFAVAVDGRNWLVDAARVDACTLSLLVVDVSHFNDRAWFDRAGNYHSDALKLTERFTLRSPDVIWYDVTIEDHNVFTRPWRIAMPIYRRVEPNMQLLEFRCNDTGS